MKIENKLTAIFILLVVCFGVFLVLPQSVKADTNLVITISDPDRPIGGQNYEGNTINTVLSNPVVQSGENRQLGTLRIIGKPEITVPLLPGQRIKIALPKGVAYMQAPKADTFKNYVEWTTTLDGKKNQISDGNGNTGMKFVASTPSSLTLEVGNIDSSAQIMIFDFVFNQEGFSKVRVAPFIEVTGDYARDPEASISRLEFFKLFYGVALQLNSSPPPIIRNIGKLNEKFSDIGDLNSVDESKIIKLVNTGLISGYEGGFLKPEQYITRAEAISVIGKIVKSNSPVAGFTDQIPAWAQAGINSAWEAQICTGYPDGTFRPDNQLTKQEAASLLQGLLEYYSY
jgi:hypothetical protein